MRIYTHLLYLGLSGLSMLALGCEAKPTPSPRPQLQPAQEGPDFEAAINISPRFDEQANAIVVEADLQPGFHVYTLGETTGRPIRLELANDGGDWKPAGDPEYPEGVKKTTALGTSVVLEGKLSCRLPVAPAVDAPGDLKGTFYYQVCTDQACDRPRSVPFAVAPENRLAPEAH